MSYSIDTSALVDAWHVLYRPSVFDSVWNNWIARLIANGKLVISRSVFDELQVGGDDLFDWVRGHRANCVCEDTEAVQTQVRAIQKDWPDPATDFGRRLRGADLFVIGHAASIRGKVVSHESAAGNFRDSRIPDACRRLGLECLSIMDVLETEGFTF